MELKNKIESDLRDAMKSRDQLRTSALRMVVAAIQNKEIEERGMKKLKQGENLDDTGVLKVISILAKQRQESIEMFKKGGRDDLVNKETAELALLEKYLPSQMSESEIEKIVEEAVRSSGAAGPKDMGNVMKIVMPQIAGRADGKIVNEIVRRKLTP
jgi:hypothetical protein